MLCSLVSFFLYLFLSFSPPPLELRKASDIGAFARETEAERTAFSYVTGRRNARLASRPLRFSGPFSVVIADPFLRFFVSRRRSHCHRHLCTSVISGQINARGFARVGSAARWGGRRRTRGRDHV